MTIEFVHCSHVAERMRSDPSTLTIVDVRDDDFEIAKLKDALHIPSEVWFGDDDEAKRKAKQVLEAHPAAEAVVFHCHFSQQRGPACARRFLEIMEELESRSPPKVQVLSGGFRTFYKFYRGEDVLENL